MLAEGTMKIINANKGIIEGTFKGYTVVYFPINTEDIYDMAAAIRTPYGEALIVVGSIFKSWDKDIQQYVLYHEVGHLVHGHTMATDKGTNEYEADAYAVEYVGKEVAVRGIQAIKEVIKDIKPNLINSMDLRINKIKG